MAKGTINPVLWTVEGPAGAHTTPGAKVAGISLSFGSGWSFVTLRSRKPRKNEPSDAQKQQRTNYSDCDCLWKFRDRQQALAWTAYVKDSGLKKRLGLDEYRIFMKSCLDWDFVDYFEKYLFARWELVSVAEADGVLTICLRVGSSLDDTLTEQELSPFAYGARLI